MDQKRIGSFLKELRKERGLTQEQLAETLGVSNRSVSRWETGTNMPDFDLLMQIARYYDVTVEEILDGERREKTADLESDAALQKVADYGNMEKLKFSRQNRFFYLAALLALFCTFVIDVLGLREVWIYGYVSDFLLGLVFGMILVGFLNTTRFMIKCRDFKMRLLKRSGDRSA